MTTNLSPVRPIDVRPEFAGILRNQEQFAGTDDDKTSARINNWFDRLMVQSGTEIASPVLLLLSLLSGLVVGGIVFVVRENPLITAMALPPGFVLPVIAVMIARARRQTKMMDQLPGMIDELARAAKTGRSIEQCFHLIAEDTAQPLGSELQLCSRKMQMGMDLASALGDLPSRTGLTTLNILVTTLAVHQQTGGDLVQVLERLSHTVRDRLLFLGRLRAATIASRATAVLMIVLPPGVVTFFAIRDPQYISDLMSSGWGRAVTILAVALQILGTAWVLRILKQTQRA